MQPVRRAVGVGGDEISFLEAGTGAPVVLLHGTYWSRVWEPVMARIAAVGRRALAPDLPGFGRSTGELEPADAAAPALADWTAGFLDAVHAEGSVGVGGHDIGGAVAQQLAVRHPQRVERLALVNSVLYDSWPVPAVKRFQSPEVRESTTVADLLEARATSLSKAVAKELNDTERDEWLSPWHDQTRVRSWTALAAAADARYTLDIVAELARMDVPMILVWGEDDAFQPVTYAERLCDEIPRASLVRVLGARHIPTEDDPETTGAALARFFRAG